MTTPQPISAKEFSTVMRRVRGKDTAAFMKRVGTESQKEFLLRKQRLRDRVAVAQAADRNGKQYSEERRQRAFKALQARKRERELAAPPPSPKTPYQQHGGDIRRRTERQAKHESELQKRKFDHDALKTAAPDQEGRPFLFGFRSPTMIRPRRKQARWEKQQRFDQGVL